MKAKPVEFQPPKDASLPEGIQPNEDFDMTCTFRLKDTGDICMTRFGEADMPCAGGSQKYEKQDKPGYGDMAQGMIDSGNG
jgi:hypothetical protein